MVEWPGDIRELETWSSGCSSPAGHYGIWSSRQNSTNGSTLTLPLA